MSFLDETLRAGRSDKVEPRVLAWAVILDHSYLYVLYALRNGQQGHKNLLNHTIVFAK